MAGLSSRFKEAGYEKPKFMLEAHGQTLFFHSVSSFRSYFATETFLFITLKESFSVEFVELECKKLGILNYEIVELEGQTRGQAETVYLGLLYCAQDKGESILVFNIDTFRPNYRLPKQFDVNKIDGYLETFIGSGKNWSNVVPKDKSDLTVSYTAEKKEISEYCCTGLYFFKSKELFQNLFEEYSKQGSLNEDYGELYIAPMYNLLIGNGLDIRFSIISKADVIFCGVPKEYEDFKHKESTIL